MRRERHRDRDKDRKKGERDREIEKNRERGRLKEIDKKCDASLVHTYMHGQIQPNLYVFIKDIDWVRLRERKTEKKKSTKGDTLYFIGNKILYLCKIKTEIWLIYKINLYKDPSKLCMTLELIESNSKFLEIDLWSLRAGFFPRKTSKIKGGFTYFNLIFFLR